jgi:Tfp pilus assembly protein PilF
MAEYFYFKNEKKKSKEFYERIISLEKSNPNILNNTQKKLNRNFSE